jgi:HK97 gp10 family phage protein
MAKEVVRVEGLAELEAALDALPEAVARTTLTRTLRKAAGPIQAEMQAKAPQRTGGLRNSIVIRTRIRNTVGFAEYSSTLAGGGSIREARGALRDARRGAGSGANAAARAEVNIVVGAPHGRLLEFGTVKMPAHPFARPAWEGGKSGALTTISVELGAEIEKSRARLARRAARLAAKG